MSGPQHAEARGALYEGTVEDGVAGLCLRTMGEQEQTHDENTNTHSGSGHSDEGDATGPHAAGLPVPADRAPAPARSHYTTRLIGGSPAMNLTMLSTVSARNWSTASAE